MGAVQKVVKRIKRMLYKQDVWVFLVFFAISASVWCVNKLSHEYYTTIEYPVELYSGISKGQIFRLTDTTLTVQLRTSGFTILKSRMATPTTLRISVDEDRFSKLTYQRNRFFILTSSITEAISNQLGDDKKITAISPDTLFFSLSMMAQKRVPVRSQITAEPEKEHMLKESVLMQPDSILISGDPVVIKGISYVQTEEKLLQNLSQTYVGTVSLVPIKGVYLGVPRVQYSIYITRYTEGVVKLPIYVENQPDDASILLLPSEAELKYKVAIEDFSHLDTSKFILSVDYNDVLGDNEKSLRVKLVSAPESVLSSTINPQFVEFIVRKN